MRFCAASCVRDQHRHGRWINWCETTAKDASATASLPIESSPKHSPAAAAPCRGTASRPCIPAFATCTAFRRRRCTRRGPAGARQRQGTVITRRKRAGKRTFILVIAADAASAAQEEEITGADADAAKRLSTRAQDGASKSRGEMDDERA